MNLNRQRNANGGKNAKIYDAIQKWYAESIEIDGTPFLGSKLENPFNDITGPGSIDHVWEKSNVGDFLGSLLGSDFDCDDMNSLFSACGVKLQKIFDQLPSMDPNNVQTGFVAMNKNLNGMKGWMFSQKFADARFGKIYDTDAKIIQGFERQAIIFDWFNSDSGIQSMHDETNNRIYSAFVALDDAISSTKIRRAKGRGDILLQFGPTYKKWYLQLLENVGSATFDWASGQVARLSADTSLPECLQKATNVFQSSPLYGEDKFKIDPSHLSWRATTIPLQKRGLVFVRDKTCVPPSNTKSSTSASSTTISSTDSFTSSSTPTKIQPSSTGTSDPKPSAVPKPTATPQPQRTCSLHLWQDRQYGRGGGRGIFDDPDVPHTYFVKVKIFDGTGEDKKEIGHHDRAKAGDADPLRVTIDKLTDPLVIQPEVRNDYIQFALGKQRWASSDGGSCKVGGWDPRRDFPAVSLTICFSSSLGLIWTDFPLCRCFRAMLTPCVFSTDTTDGLYFQVLEGVAVAPGQRSWAIRRRNARYPGSRTTLINGAILATCADDSVKTGRFILLSDGVINDSVRRCVYQIDRPRDILILNTMSDVVGSQRLTAFSAIYLDLYHCARYSR